MKIDRNLIYDVGMNVGTDTVFYLTQGYRVVAVEADPVLAEKARQRFRVEIEQGRLQIVNVGIFDYDGVADFWLCEEKPEFNSFDPRIASRDGFHHRKIQIQTMRFSSVLERYGVPFYLKIDIEGNDQMCVDALRCPDLPKYVSIESECPGEHIRQGPEEGLQVLQKLHGLGYKGFKLIDQTTFCSLSLPASRSYQLDNFARRYFLNPPINRVKGSYRLATYMVTRIRQEKKHKWDFPWGCSGTWGEDTAGFWMDYEQAYRTYTYYRALHFKDQSALFYSFWCDWHARL